MQTMYESVRREKVTRNLQFHLNRQAASSQEKRMKIYDIVTTIEGTLKKWWAGPKWETQVSMLSESLNQEVK